MPYTLKTGRIHVKDPVTGEYGQFDASAEPIVDAALSGTSENPVQNRAVKAALDQKADSTDITDLYNDLNDVAETANNAASRLSDLSDVVNYVSGQLANKQNKPSAAGTAGQMFGLDSNLAPVWKTPYPLNYELIADITLSEDTEDFIINKFSDNSPLAITDFIMECDFKAAPSTSYLGAIFKDSNGVTQYMPTGQMLTDSDKTAYYWTERYGSLVRMFANRPYGWDATTYDQPYYYNILYDSPTIREINLYKYSDSAQPIPAGSRIRLWGVRA